MEDRENSERRRVNKSMSRRSVVIWMCVIGNEVMMGGSTGVSVLNQAYSVECLESSISAMSWCRTRILYVWLRLISIRHVVCQVRKVPLGSYSTCSLQLKTLDYWSRLRKRLGTRLLRGGRRLESSPSSEVMLRRRGSCKLRCMCGSRRRSPFPDSTFFTIGLGDGKLKVVETTVYCRVQVDLKVL